MTLREFRNLGYHEQLKLVFEKAEFVDSVMKDSTVYALYSMQNYFIELRYDMKEFRLENLKVFEANESLDKYLSWPHNIPQNQAINREDNRR